ncbi:hypothetical protein MtrunA17_Chr8g0336431 [Medicago truncatula]|uniref:Uncharacterized protein n=1 Tax=Medicago truncatula TaxID=3880 RepID=A0A396GIZ7_MEDTR|nr:hypothetical protein MtrunA17_Chr8g0336431 [Medicago truncatula]
MQRLKLFLVNVMVPYLLTQKRFDIYNKTVRNVDDLYEKHLYEKHINLDFNLDVWADVSRLFKKRYKKSDEQAKKIGKIGEKLANAYLTEMYNDEVNGVEIR